MYFPLFGKIYFSTSVENGNRAISWSVNALMWECVNVGMRECVNVVIIHFCVCCENIGTFCEIDVWKNGCNFAASNELNNN